MADSKWDVGTFLKKLANALTLKGLDKEISSMPDIDEEHDWSDYWDKSISSDEKNYWNQSVKNLWDSWKKLDDSKDNSDKIKRIKNADAGWRFTGEPYVNPDLNIDNEAYEKVRGDDKIESVLKNSKQMQYTHSQQQIEGDATDQNKSKYTKDGEEYSKYIRLLMPKYLRRVEVEDLNRNFWVIAQAIGLISEYLLDPNSLLNKLLEGILKEIIQLWDNTHRIWEALYALGEKVNKHDDQISGIAEATQKTKVGISLNTYPSYETKGKEFRRMLGEENETAEIILNSLYFLSRGSGYGKGYQGQNDTSENSSIAYTIANGNLSNKEEMKTLFKIPDDVPDVIKTNDDLAKWIPHINNYIYSLLNGGEATYDRLYKNGGAFRIGCAIVYTINNQKKMVVYDKAHPYYPTTSDFFGAYQWCRRLGENGVALLVNDIIKDIYEDDIEAAKNILNSSTDSDQHYGPITIERDGVNKKPLNKILAEISGFNFAFLDAFGLNSSENYNHILAKDLIPEILLYSDLLYGFLSTLCDFETSGMQSYKAENGENVSVIWTIPSVILSKSFEEKISLGMQNAYYKELGRAYINKITKLLEKDESKTKQLKNLKNNYETFLVKYDDDTYYNLLSTFLSLMELMPEDIMKGQAIIASADEKVGWLNTYEQKVKEAINDKENFCYKYLMSSSPIWKNKTYRTCMPWLILEPTRYGDFTNIKCSTNPNDNYSDRYSTTVKDTNKTYSSNIWKLISSILPRDCFQVCGGKRLIANYEEKGDSKIPILEWVNIYESSDGNGPLNNLDNAADNNLLKSNDKYDLYNVSKIPLILGTLEGWDVSSVKDNKRGMASLQPYYSKSLDNYWISFSSGNLTGGRVHMKIVNSNYRFFSPFHGCKGVISGAVGECYDASPHNTSITLGYYNPLNKEAFQEIKLNQIVNFNSPEYSPNGMYSGQDDAFTSKIVYNYMGNKRDGNNCYVTKRASVGNKDTEDGLKQMDIVADGFLGYYDTSSDFYNIEENFNYENFDINNLLPSSIKNYFRNIDNNQKSYKLQSPAFWTQGKQQKKDEEKKVFKTADTFYKIREVYPYGSYGILNGSAALDYNEIKMGELLPEGFFNGNNKDQEIFTVQTDFQRFSIAGLTKGIYAALYIGKSTKEIDIQNEYSSVDMTDNSSDLES